MWMMFGTDITEDCINTKNNHEDCDGNKFSFNSTTNQNRLYQCLSALDQDIQRLSKLSIDAKASNTTQLIDNVNNSYVGYYHKTSTDNRTPPMLSFFASPSQLNQLSSTKLDEHRLNSYLDLYTKQYSFSVRKSQSHNTLQIQPILNSHAKSSSISFSNVDGIKGISLDAEFVMILKNLTPVQLSVINDIENITNLPLIKYSSDDLINPYTTNESDTDLYGDDFLNLLHFVNGQNGLERLDNILSFPKYGIEQVYRRKNQKSSVRGFLVKEIPFTSPAQLVEVIAIIRKQVKFNSLLSTFLIHQPSTKFHFDLPLNRLEIDYKLIDIHSLQLQYNVEDRHYRLTIHDNKINFKIPSSDTQKVNQNHLERIYRLTQTIPIIITYLLKIMGTKLIDEKRFLPVENNNTNMKEKDVKPSRILRNLSDALSDIVIPSPIDSCGILAGGSIFRCLLTSNERLLKTLPHSLLSFSMKMDEENKGSQKRIDDSQQRPMSKLDDLLSSSVETINSDLNESLNKSFPSSSSRPSPLILRYFSTFNEPFRETRTRAIDQISLIQKPRPTSGMTNSTSLSQLFASVGGIIAQPSTCHPNQNQFCTSETHNSQVVGPGGNPHVDSSASATTTATSQQDKLNKTSKSHHNDTIPQPQYSNNNNHQSGNAEFSQSLYQPASSANSSLNSNPPGSMLISLLNEEMPKKVNPMTTNPVQSQDLNPYATSNSNGNDVYSESSINSNKTRSPIDVDMGYPMSNKSLCSPNQDRQYSNRPFSQDNQNHPHSLSERSKSLNSIQSNNNNSFHTSTSANSMASSSLFPGNPNNPMNHSKKRKVQPLSPSNSTSTSPNNKRLFNPNTLTPSSNNPAASNVGMPQNFNANNPMNTTPNQANQNQTQNQPGISQNPNLAKSLTPSVYDFDDHPGMGPNLASMNTASMNNLQDNMQNRPHDMNMTAKGPSCVEPNMGPVNNPVKPFQEDMNPMAPGQNPLQTSLKLKIKGNQMMNSTISSQPMTSPQNKAPSQDPYGGSGNPNELPVPDRTLPKPSIQKASNNIVSGKPAAEVMRKIQEPMDQNKGGMVRKKTAEGDPQKPRKRPKVVHPNGLTASQMRAAEGRKPLGRPPGSKNSSGPKPVKSANPVNQMKGPLDPNPMVGPMMGNSNGSNQSFIHGQMNQNAPNAGLIANGMSIYNLTSSGSGYKIPKLKSSSSSVNNNNNSQLKTEPTKPNSVSNPVEDQSPATGIKQSPQQQQPQLNAEKNPNFDPNALKKSKKGINEVMTQLRHNQSSLPQTNPSPNVTLQKEDLPMKKPPQDSPVTGVQPKTKSHKVDTDTPASPTPESPPGIRMTESLHSSTSNQPVSCVNIPAIRNNPPVNNDFNKPNSNSPSIMPQNQKYPYMANHKKPNPGPFPHYQQGMYTTKHSNEMNQGDQKLQNYPQQPWSALMNSQNQF